jgi:hypothetical protein
VSRADCLTRDPRWPAIALELRATAQSSLPISRLAVREGIPLQRLRRACLSDGVERLTDLEVVVQVRVPASGRASLLEVCARRGWAVLGGEQ